MNYSLVWTKLDETTFPATDASAGFDTTSGPTLINIIDAIAPATIDPLVESHKTYIFTLTAAANGSTKVFTLNRLIDPCPSATLIDPYPLPVTNYIKTGTNEIN